MVYQRVIKYAGSKEGGSEEGEKFFNLERIGSRVLRLVELFYSLGACLKPCKVKRTAAWRKRNEQDIIKQGIVLFSKKIN